MYESPFAIKGFRFAITPDVIATPLLKSMVLHDSCQTSFRPTRLCLKCPKGLRQKLVELYPSKLILLDSSFFCQLYLAAARDSCSRSTTFLFELNPCPNALHMVDSTHSMCHIRISSNKLYRYIDSVCPPDIVGKFVIRFNDNNFMGITPNGIAIMDSNHWASYGKQLCSEWVHNRSIREMSKIAITKNILCHLLTIGELDDWCIDRNILAHIHEFVSARKTHHGFISHPYGWSVVCSADDCD